MKALKEKLPAHGPIAPALEDAGLPTPWLIYSPDTLRIKQLVRWSAEQLLVDTKNCKTIFAGELSGAAALSGLTTSLSMLSLFSTREIILLLDAESLKAPALRTISSALEKQNGSTLLILAPKNEKQAGLADLAKGGTAVMLEPLEGPYLIRWIEKEAQRLGAAGIAPDAAALLADSFGESLTALSGELARLSLLCGAEEQIGSALVRKYSPVQKDADAFELVGAMARRDSVHALKLIRSLIDQGQHPLQTSGFLSRCFRVLLAQNGKQGHHDNSPINPELTNYYFVKNLSRIGSAFSTPELRFSLDVLQDLDWQLKSSPLDEELLLQSAADKIARRKYFESIRIQ